MRLKYYKIGVVYGHCGSGNGIPVIVPILASDILHALKRAEKMGGIKKSFRNFWYAKEIDKMEFIITRDRWLNFKTNMNSRRTVFNRRII